MNNGNKNMNLDRLPATLHVSAGESVAASMLRSLGGRLNDAATFFGVPGMDTSHPLMRCEFPLIANSLYPLQDGFNAALMDANAIRAEDWDATEEDSFSSIAIGRAVVKDAIARDRSADEIIDAVIDAVGWQPDDYASDKEARMSVGLRYADKLPDDRRIALVDHASPWSILMALAGVPGAELMRFDIPKGPAGSMANGALEVDRGAAVRFIAEETALLADALRPIWGMWGDDADETQAQAIAAMTPAQVATAWQLLPADRTQIELHSPYFVRLDGERDDGDRQ